MRRLGGLCAALLLAACAPRVMSNSQCTYNSDCPTNLQCVQSMCRAACRVDVDCTTGNVCRATSQAGVTACVAPDTVATCSVATDCGPNAACVGQRCFRVCAAATATADCAGLGACVTEGGSGAFHCASGLLARDTPLPPGSDAGVPEAGAEGGVTASRSCPAGTSTPGCGTVRIEGGTFDMGDTGGVGNATPPQPGVTVSAFTMDRYEVTVARFRRFIDAGALGSSGASVRYPGGQSWDFRNLQTGQPLQQLPLTTAGCNWSTAAAGREDHPLNCVNVFTAQAFCVWDGGRLPTDAEWEWVARGRAAGGLAAGRSYPWGEDGPSADCARSLNALCVPLPTGTRAVGLGTPLPMDPSLALYDLSGNVREYTADNYNEYMAAGAAGCWNQSRPTNPLCVVTNSNVAEYVNYLVRGGGWQTDVTSALRGSTRVSSHGTDGLNANTGFRCVR